MISTKTYDRNKNLIRIKVMLQIPFKSQIELRRGLGQICRETAELAELLAVRPRERACRDVKYQLAALRFEAALIRHALVLWDGLIETNAPS